MARPMKDLKGRKFGMLRVIRKADDRNTSGAIMWVCQCSCGGDKNVTGSALMAGHTRSCGCVRRLALNATELNHLESRTKELSSIWLSQPLVSA